MIDRRRTPLRADSYGSQRGFALPTVLISSIVMLLVLLSALVSASSVSTTLDQQYNNQLLKEAADSGIVMAKACIVKTGTPKWSSASPLRPDSGCSGSSAACSASSCYLVNDQNTKTTFTVDAPTLNSDGSYTINVTGMISQYSTSSATVVSTTTKKTIAKMSNGWKQISAGQWFACGVAYNDRAYCWGFNGDGQLGDGTTTSRREPVPVDTTGVLAGKTIKQVATSLRTSCAIASDDKAYCWGYNSSNYGVLGNNSSINNTPNPVAVYTGGVLSGKTITQIAGGGHHFCALDSNGLAYCWGENVVGDLGNNTSNSTANPAPVAVYTAGALSGKALNKISIGRDHSCALSTTFTAYCWGYGYYGQIGNGSSSSTSVPYAVTGGSLAGKSVVDIDAGYYHTCAVTSDGKAHCWGENADGQVGNGATATVYTPVAVTATGVLNGKTVTDVNAGYHFSCAVASGGVYCWGNNSSGQLGNNSTASSTVPVAMDTTGALNGTTAISVETGWGQSTSYVMASNNRFYGAGDNYGYPFGFWTTNSGSYLLPVIGGTVQSAVTY